MQVEKVMTVVPNESVACRIVQWPDGGCAEKHVENPSTDSPVKDLTNMQLNMFLVCATGAFQPKTRIHHDGDVATTPPTASRNVHTASLSIHAKAPPQGCHNSTTTNKKAQTFSAPCKQTKKNVPNKCIHRPASQHLPPQQLCERPRLKNPSRH